MKITFNSSNSSVEIAVSFSPLSFAALACAVKSATAKFVKVAGSIFRLSALALCCAAVLLAAMTLFAGTLCVCGTICKTLCLPQLIAVIVCFSLGFCLAAWFEINALLVLRRLFPGVLAAGSVKDFVSLRVIFRSFLRVLSAPLKKLSSL